MRLFIVTVIAIKVRCLSTETPLYNLYICIICILSILSYSWLIWLIVLPIFLANKRCHNVSIINQATTLLYPRPQGREH